MKKKCIKFRFYFFPYILASSLTLDGTYLSLVVGISATMCHSAEKIPAKEGCQSKRVSKKQQIYPSRVFKYAPLGTTSTAQGSQRCPTGSAESPDVLVGFEIFQSPKKQESYPSISFK